MKKNREFCGTKTLMKTKKKKNISKPGYRVAKEFLKMNYFDI